MKCLLALAVALAGTVYGKSAPAADTIEWYRLACSLPPQLPADAYLQDDRTAHARAQADYAYILEQLGNCPRIRT